MRYIKRLMLKLTNKCNLVGCKYCYTGANKPEGEEGLGLDVYRKLIAHLINDQPHGRLEELSLTGGEPLLRKDLPALIDFALSHKISTRINTNGILVGRGTAQELSGLALKYKTLVVFQVGLDSAMKGAYEFIRGRGFDQAVEGVKNLTQYRNKHTLISLRYTMMQKPYKRGDKIILRDPVEDARDYVNFASKLRVNKIKIRELLTTGYGYGLHDYMLPAGKIAAIQKIFVDEMGGYPNLKLEITWPSRYGTAESIPEEFRDKVRISPCKCLENFITVDVDGGIVGCVLLIGHKEQYLGNILQEDIIDVFHGTTACKMIDERYRRGREQSRCYAIDHTHEEAGIDVAERIAEINNA